MHLKFSPGEKAETISGLVGWIHRVTIYKDSVMYCMWDGADKFTNLDEWQLKKTDKKQIGFNVDL